MTKHLRLIMLSLLAMICLGGYSQSEVIIWQEDWTGAKAGQKVNKINTNYSAQNDGTTIYNEKLAGGVAPELLLKKSDTFVVTIEDLKGCSGELTLTYKSNNKNITSIKANDKPVTFTLNDKDRTAKITINEGTTSLKLEFSCKENTRLDNFKLVGNAAGESQKKTSLSFPGEGVTLINGKLANGNDFNGYTATEKDNVAGTIAYAASGDGVATVDANTGAVTVAPNVSGTTTITATFTPTDATTYAISSASYTITNTKVYTSIADLKKDITTVEEKSFVLNLTNAIVTYTNRNSAFIQDESAGIFIYIKGGHKLEAGNTFTGTVNVKAMVYNDLAEITSWTSTVTPTQSEVPEPVVVTLAELKGDNYSKYESVRCKVVGVTVTKGMNVQDGEISQNGTIMPVRGGVANLTMTQDAILDMIGYPTIFKGIKQFQVWKNSDMTEHQTVKEITLDENSDNIVEEAKNVNVTLKRTLYGDGGWNTLCVPFSLTAAQVTAAFGNDVELRKLSSIEGTTLKFVSTDIITAGEPCLIKVAKDGSTYNFEGVATIAVANNKDYTFSMVSGDIQFLGIYSPMDVVTVNPAGPSTGYYAFLGEGNKFFKAQAETKMKGFRAFFLVPNNVPSNALKAVIDGTATDIEDLVIDGVKANGRVYNLNGQYVGNSLNGLQPGLYIQNGKKIVVK